jgi:chromosome segregation ATPase
MDRILLRWPLLVAYLFLCSAQKEAPAAVTKVVNLLTELEGRIGQDQTEDQAVFDKYACWCEESTQKKAAEITAARDEIEKLGNSILQLKGEVATTIAEIKELMNDIKKNEEAQKETTAVREKENTAFQAESTELSESLSALEKAMTVLRSATGGGAALLNHLATVRKAAAHLPDGLQSKMQPNIALIAAAAERVERLRYQPQSATIQGILSDMYDTFGTTLETITHTEADRHRTYEDLMATYQKELLTMQEMVTKKEKSKAEAEAQLAEHTESYTDVEGQLKADVDYFDATKASCVSKADAWRERKALRDAELEGISKALEILTSDEARDLFAKAIQPGFQAPAFLQKNISSDVAPVSGKLQLDGAYRQLQAHAKQSHSLRLARLATSVRDVGHFEDVLKAIDTMVATLKEEEQTDITRADECGVQLHTITMTKEKLNWTIEKNDAKIEKLGKIKEDKELEKKTTLEELATVESDIKNMTDERTADNAKFKQDKADDEKAIELLVQAKTVLAQYYESNGMALSLLSEKIAAEPIEPDATFKGTGDRKLEAKGIVQILEMITEDLQAEISSAVKAEAEAQTEYEARLAAAEALQGELTKRSDNIDEALALNEEATTDETNLKTENEEKLTTEEKTEQDLKPSCDWIKENIDARRTKRASEMERLRTAREYLAGASPSTTLVQQARKPERGQALRGQLRLSRAQPHRK